MATDYLAEVSPQEMHQEQPWKGLISGSGTEQPTAVAKECSTFAGELDHPIQNYNLNLLLKMGDELEQNQHTGSKELGLIEALL